ncbi:MAG: hypoxanthine phosphoribosyltransferase [Bacteroidota bacterium]
MIQVKDRHFEVMVSAEQLQKDIAVLAARINEDYAGKEPLFVAVLNGAFMFTADLLKMVTIPCEVTFVKVASYEGMSSTGQVEEILGLEADLTNRHIIILEDIVDTGLTMTELLRNLRDFRPASVEVATLLLKPECLKFPLSIKYVAREIPNIFVLGFGLDYDGFGRNTRELYCLAAPEIKVQSELNIL